MVVHIVSMMKKMKKIFAVILVLLSMEANAQTWEMGAFAGLSNYFGDLAPVAFVPRETHSAAGGFIRYYPSKFLSFRLGLTYGVISGSDKNALNPQLQARNLSFKSSMLDLALVAEYNILGYDNYLQPFTPYIFAGVGGFHFNPRASYKGEWVYLQALGTEGQGTTAYPQRKKYPLYQFSIPMGLGVRFALANLVNMGAEIGLRKTFTDYLDDVSTSYVDQMTLIGENGSLANALSNRSGELTGIPVIHADGEQRGDPSDMDWFGFAGVTFSFTLTGMKGGKHSGFGCPATY